MLHKSKLMLPLLAAAIGFGASAFTAAPRQSAHPNAIEWFQLTGTDPSQASSYTLASGGTGADPNCPTEEEQVCAVRATQVGSGINAHPDQNELDVIKANSNDFTQQADNLEYKAAE